MKKYYVEIRLRDKTIKEKTENNFLVQSRWYYTKEKAIQWADEIDYKDEVYDVCLMSAEWNERTDTYREVIFEQLLK